MDTLSKVLIGVGVVAAGITVVGVYEHYKAAPAGPGYLSGTSSATLTPGAMLPVILSYSKGDTYTFALPPGATFGSGNGSAFTSDNPSTIPTPTASVSPVTVKPAAQGQANLTINWMDAKANAQTSTVMITVNS